ncbi:phosphopantetheine-binding protein [Actinomadura sp. WAC 06369]|uniref:phosphopantetheine-binding protein n=1 Tax=Actinomadura sp. WAC 06369 TaxID=2203193 RepID=UPI000F7B8F4E|nr:phosphopantetheine-binding protein [Actinomadura sp. WAC 06369]RSN70830.1 acyl carrier protein [Actinomadura sp. WAC 06369]
MSSRPSLDEFLTVLEDAYETAKRIRRTIRPEDDIARGLGLDSLDALELLVVLELTYGTSLIDVPAIVDVETVGDLYELLIAQSP